MLVLRQQRSLVVSVFFYRAYKIFFTISCYDNDTDNFVSIFLFPKNVSNVSAKLRIFIISFLLLLFPFSKVDNGETDSYAVGRFVGEDFRYIDAARRRRHGFYTKDHVESFRVIRFFSLHHTRYHLDELIHRCNRRTVFPYYASSCAHILPILPISRRWSHILYERKALNDV